MSEPSSKQEADIPTTNREWLLCQRPPLLPKVNKLSKPLQAFLPRLESRCHISAGELLRLHNVSNISLANQYVFTHRLLRLIEKFQLNNSLLFWGFQLLTAEHRKPVYCSLQVNRTGGLWLTCKQGSCLRNSSGSILPTPEIGDVPSPPPQKPCPAQTLGLPGLWEQRRLLCPDSRWATGGALNGHRSSQATPKPRLPCSGEFWS